SAAPVARIPFTATAGQTVRAFVDGIPGGTTDFILTVRNAANQVVGGPVDTGTSPEFLISTFATAGTYTYEISGFHGDLGDFTFTIRTAVPGAANSAVLLTAQDYGQNGGNDVQAEFRRQTGANRPLSIMVNGKLIEVFLATDANGALSSTAKQVVD